MTDSHTATELVNADRGLECRPTWPFAPLSLPKTESRPVGGPGLGGARPHR